VVTAEAAQTLTLETRHGDAVDVLTPATTCWPAVPAPGRAASSTQSASAP
jgi:hypothetical protein